MREARIGGQRRKRAYRGIVHVAVRVLERLRLLEVVVLVHVDGAVAVRLVNGFLAETDVGDVSTGVSLRWIGSGRERG